MKYFALFRKLECLLICTAILIVGCKNLHSNGNEDQKSKIESIGDFSKCEKQYDIVSIEKINNGGDKNSLLFFYASSCGLVFNKDSIISVDGYVINFKDKSNTSVDVVRFVSEDYARKISDKLVPLVHDVRSISENHGEDRFCLGYYLSRIYNFAKNGSTLYLCGYDRENVTSADIKLKDLKYLDKICEVLQERE